MANFTRSNSDTSLSLTHRASRRAVLRHTLRTTVARLRHSGARTTESFVSDQANRSTSGNPTQKLARRHLVLACLEFTVDGVFNKRMLTRQQILEIARSHLAPPPPIPPTPRTPPPKRSPSPPPKPVNNPLPPLQLNKRGGAARVRLRNAAVAAPRVQRRRRAANALTIRDLRQMDPDFSAKPALWVRQNALVVSLERVRALILFDRMLLFDAESHSDLVAYMRPFLLAPRNPQDFYQPFEFRALDVILDFTGYILVREYDRLEPLIHTTLAKLSTGVTAGALEDLRVDEQKLNILFARITRTQTVLQELLDQDDDMAAMYLTEKWRNPDRERAAAQHDEAEALLESHLQTVEYLCTKSELLTKAIDDTEGLIEIRLDTMQNRLLLTDLVISAITTVFSFGSMVASIFGMNLMLPKQMRYLPSSKFYFYGCIALVSFAMVIAMIFIMTWTKRLVRANEKALLGEMLDISPLRRMVAAGGRAAELTGKKSRRKSRSSSSSSRM